MANKKRECYDKETSNRIDRRSYLKLAGGAAAALGAGATAGSAAAADDYEVVTVSPGETFSTTVSSGETFENTLIDISAKGATFDIEATGSDWVVRNVGIKGVWDQYEKAEPFRVSVDKGSTGRIENFYFADGCPDDTYAGVTGIYVYKHHAGTVQIDRVNIQDMPDNAIYASTPGRPSDPNHSWDNGGGGAVEITNSYAADCQASHFRIGSDGSFVKNCVAVGGDGGHRGILGRFNDTKAIDCDVSGHKNGDVACGTFEWATGVDASVSLENCRFETKGANLTYKGAILGKSVGTPRTEPPAGVPRSPEEAAGGSTDQTKSTDTKHKLPSQLTIETNEGGPLVEYELTIDGTIEKGSNSETYDTIAENDDGTTTVTGVTGNGYTDDFRFEGDLADFSAGVDAEHYRVLVDGEEVDLSSDTQSERTLTVATDEGGPLIEYELTIDGTIEKGPNSETYDTIAENDDGTITVTGVTGNGYTDDYVIVGTVADWSIGVDSEHYRILVDGTDLTSASN
jgi:hypothetical protein